MGIRLRAAYTLVLPWRKGDGQMPELLDRRRLVLIGPVDALDLQLRVSEPAKAEFPMIERQMR